MIDVDLLSVIRRWHGRDQLSIREISRRTGLSRHTIRKYLVKDLGAAKELLEAYNIADAALSLSNVEAVIGESISS